VRAADKVAGKKGADGGLHRARRGLCRPAGAQATYRKPLMSCTLEGTSLLPTTHSIPLCNALEHPMPAEPSATDQ
jgi:hypothetical protein